MRTHRLSAGLVLVLVLGLASATSASAQRNQVSVDASVFGATAGYSLRVAPRALIGIELGVALPQIDRTLAPSTDQPGTPDFEEFLHLGGFVRLAPSARFELDTGLCAGVGDLWECTASDCWPQPFAGLYVQPMIGWTRIKLGARLTAGWIGESRDDSAGSTFMAGLSPFLVRATFPL